MTIFSSSPPQRDDHVLEQIVRQGAGEFLGLQSIGNGLGLVVPNPYGDSPFAGWILKQDHRGLLDVVHHKRLDFHLAHSGPPYNAKCSHYRTARGALSSAFGNASG